MNDYNDIARPDPQEPFSTGLTLLAAAAQSAIVCDDLGIAPVPAAFMLLVVGMTLGAAAILATPPYSWR
ncbi:hypothetical protein OG225_42940 (plasmid) [Nocardia sp. NBC_01377]|uniref:hypothetical protein n=1 Tax=Nocardia sp. NBC_01377 TaxID=2903595 RepID=UPI002F90FC7F